MEILFANTNFFVWFSIRIFVYCISAKLNILTNFMTVCTFVCYVTYIMCFPLEVTIKQLKDKVKEYESKIENEVQVGVGRGWVGVGQ